MTITLHAGDAEITYTADGTTTLFDIPFSFSVTAEIAAYVNGTAAEGITIAGAGNPFGGTLLFGSAPIADAMIRIRRLQTVHVSGNDTTADALAQKLVAGSNITLTEQNDGGNETLQIAAVVPPDPADVKVSSNDSTAGFLNGKLVAGSGITLTELDDGNDERLEISQDPAFLPVGPYGNLLLNPSFQINQRRFAGGSLTAGVYGYDRWKAGTGGATVSVAGNGTITLLGAIVQIIEQPGLADATVTVSVRDLSGGSLSVDVAGETGTITAGAGLRSVTLNVSGAATGNVAVSLTAASTVTFNLVQLLRGADGRLAEPRPFATELDLCKRYYEKSYNYQVAPGASTREGLAGGSSFAWKDSASWIEMPTSIRFQVAKRATPALAFWDGVGNSGKVSQYASAGNSAFPLPGWHDNAASLVLVTAGENGFLAGLGAIQQAWGIFVHFTADAEL